MSSQPTFHSATPLSVSKPIENLTQSLPAPELSREERRIVLESMAAHLESCAGDSLCKRETARRYRAMAASLHDSSDAADGTEGGNSSGA